MAEDIGGEVKMTEPTTPKQPVNPPPAQNKQKRWYTIAGACFALCGLAYGIYYFTYGQYHETTDDAYVNGNLIMVTPQVSGIITQILVDNTQIVEAGQPLVLLDRHDYEIALEKAKADLGDTVRSVVQMFIKVDELKAKREASEATVIRTTLDYNHRKALVDDQSVSLEDFQHSETDLANAIATLKEVEKELEGAIAEVINTTIPKHPKVEQAKAALRQAYLSLHRCRVLAPTKGLITQRRAQVGQWTNQDDKLMALVPIDQMWVDANFREVSLKNLRIGQPVKLVADMYGSSVTYHGEVVGLNPGTGSVFSILPPQNATGNWIKIIQRVPVKISLNALELQQYPLVLGLSMTVNADTHQRSGLQLPTTSAVKPIYLSDVYTDELVGVEVMIDQIIADNSHG